MKIKLIILSLFLSISGGMSAQNDEAVLDSLMPIKLEEVAIISKPLINYTKQNKPLSSIDEYLDKSLNVSLVRRGSYAWEPMLNNMSSERLLVTIDGMHIFGACTDKMDPITSYVDVSNLSDVKVSSGQEGAAYGATIGGSIDLMKKKHEYCHYGWNGSLNLGYESNSSLFTAATRVKYSGRKFFIDADFIYRDADNYKAGKRTLIPFSQFTKYNTSISVGAKLNHKNSLSGSFTFDNATNIGYPALPMDVALARAYIASVEHTAEYVNEFIDEWTTRVYYNTIKHIMDDTKRPDVPMHMDMPGWSTTYGVYSRLKGSHKRQKMLITANAYWNKAKAEMTMYPKDSTSKSMFMYTWPDVQTIYAGVNLSNSFSWNQLHKIKYGASLGFHKNLVANDVGLNSLRIFYPELKAGKNRILYSLQTGYTLSKNKWEYNIAMAYGERAPSVSEGYGFYLFNSFDGYDYIGNPNLKNEKSIELNTSVTYKIPKIKWNIGLNYFHLLDYIIGVPNAAYASMTIGAKGVRVYQSLKSADIVSTTLGVEYRPHPSWKTRVAFSYNFGQDFKHEHLPLVRPFSFKGGLTYMVKGLEMEINVDGASKHYAYSKMYGESAKSAYAIVNFAAGYTLPLKEHQLHFRVGVENIADTYYSNYSDWNNIPRKGRNFYINIAYTFDNRRMD